MQQSNNDKVVLLKDILKELGYENDKPLSDWVQDIMQKTEVFEQYIPKENKRPATGSKEPRQSHMKVLESSKILIENLCLLKRYMRAFPKQRSGEDKKWEPFEFLYQEKKDKEKFKEACEKYESFLKRQEKINTRTKEELQSFYEVIISKTDGIDIRDTSIPDLMSEIKPNNILQSYISPHEILLWQQIVELKNELEKKPDDIDIKRKLAEKYYQFKEETQAISLLEEIVELYPQDGYSWADLAIIYFANMNNSSSDSTKALARNDFSGPIANPISGEEYWINEQIEDSLCKYESWRIKFIKAALKTLTYWKDKREFENYTWYGNNNTDIFNWRAENLFYILIMSMDKTIATKEKETFLALLKSFQTHFENSSVFPEVHTFISKMPFYTHLTSLLKNIDISIYQQFLQEFVKQFENSSWNSEEHLFILGKSKISIDFLEMLGYEEFDNMYKKIEKFIYINREWEYFKCFANKVEHNIFNFLKPVIEMCPCFWKQNKYTFEEIWQKLFSCSKELCKPFSAFFEKENKIEELHEKSDSHHYKEVRAILFLSRLFDIILNNSKESEAIILNKYSFIDDNAKFDFACDMRNVFSDRDILDDQFWIWEEFIPNLLKKNKLSEEFTLFIKRLGETIIEVVSQDIQALDD
jgi:hypothetical protein